MQRFYAGKMAKTTTPHDWVQHATRPGKIERIEAYFGGHGYTPHRHDTYAIGRTLAGVQSFQYRRAQRHSLPGTILVLHPDEIHDGEAGTEAGFHYRMAYIEPSLIQQILGGKPLPFIEGGLSSDPRLQAAIEPLLQDMDSGIDPMEETDALYDLAHALVAVAGQRRIRRHPDFIAVERARAFIHEAMEQTITLDVLAEASGLDRWQLCRDFRALYGTSPYGCSDQSVWMPESEHPGAIWPLSDQFFDIYQDFRQSFPSIRRYYPAGCSNCRRAIHRLDNANSVSTCAAFFARPR
ncbi:AraC family ligand binding domain-containing protein [Stenotrophomonas maltophilia group sp. LNF336]